MEKDAKDVLTGLNHMLKHLSPVFLAGTPKYLKNHHN